MKRFLKTLTHYISQVLSKVASYIYIGLSIRLSFDIIDYTELSSFPEQSCLLTFSKYLFLKMRFSF